MLHVLPPPRAPNPPSPWESILCASGNAGSPERTPWGDVKQTAKRPPPRAKLHHHLKFRQRSEESSCTASGEDDENSRTNKSLSECYFAGKGTALVLPPHERLRPSRRPSTAGSDIQQHLQSMFYLLRQEETLKMAVKLESVHTGRTRYLVVVSCVGRQGAEESCLLGIDCNERTTVGLVLRVLADTTITLDGDGGFSVSVCGRQHIFKPVSVQAMWSALQTLHKVSSKAREQNYFQGGPTHDWVSYYEQHIESDRSCLNEWHAMDNLESRRPPSPDSVRTKPRERDETEKVIRSTLKEIMMSVDLDEVTSKYIRNRLEEDLDMDLGEFKSFIDQEMLIILGQMDAPTEIFEHVYLGSEWNASNFEELQKNGVGHILNVTREIDNFFPGMFDYLNIRVYDDEKTDLLKYWDNTFKYITKAKNEGSKVLVHCKMGVSRSASVVIAYAMKAYNWDFQRALKHVKEKRNCIKPNTSFIAQLETYQGILDAMKNKEKLQRSKSETNLKSPEMVNKGEKRSMASSEQSATAQSQQRDQALPNNLSGQELKNIGARPKSWSPDVQAENNLLLERSTLAPVFLSLENLSKEVAAAAAMNVHTSPEVRRKSASCPPENARNVLMPFNNGQSYSVSPNQIMHICKKRSESLKPAIKHRIYELQSLSLGSLSKKLLRDKRHMVLQLGAQLQLQPQSQPQPQQQVETSQAPTTEVDASPETHIPPMLTAKLVKKEIWDPGEKKPTTVISYANGLDANHPSCESCDPPKTLTPQDPGSVVWTSSTVLRQSVPLLDNNSEKNVENPTTNVSCPDSVHKTVPEVFCSKTVLGVIGNSNNKVVPLSRKEGDLFSNQLDRVFEREERKQQRYSLVAVPAPVPDVPAAAVDEAVRECPSRQSSWSSYDSAVVLGYQGESRDAPSRHSSWGSGDTRTLPSRNSSWGSYDMRPPPPPPPHTAPDHLEHSSSSGLFAYDRDEIPWYPGTVRRTKQKLEAGKERSSSDIKPPPPDFGDAAPGQPHKSPSTETLTSDYSVSVLSEADAAPCEAYNAGLLHYTSSPDLCDSKKESHQRGATLAVEQPFYSKNAISKEIDIVHDSSDKYRSARFSGGSRLSVSAPETSSLSLMPAECMALSSCSASSILGGTDDSKTRTTKPDNAGSVIYTAQCSSVKKHKNYLENLHKETDFTSRRNLHADNAHSDADNNSSSSGSSCVSGIVQSLKKEFEAKTTSVQPVAVAAAAAGPGDGAPDFDYGSIRFKSKGSSLPSSPINSTYTECRQTNDDSNEDVSVKELVGKYEVVGSNRAVNNKALTSDGPATRARCIFDKLFSNNQNKNMRYSCIEMMSDEGGKVPASMLISATSTFPRPELDTEPVEPTAVKRPPLSSGGPLPSVVVATVVKAASKKQKFNRKDTHNCLNIKPRNNNPVYNTM